MRRTRSLKAALKGTGPVIGSWITFAQPSIAEIMATAGFDWLAIDLEHSTIGIHEAGELIRVVELAGCAPVVRVSSNDPAQIKRVMDAGAHGVIVPMVCTKADAERAVAAVRYPPAGTRGVGLGRAQAYGAGFADYEHWQASESVVVVQVEHVEAVEHLDEILAVEGVDAFLVGPYDLSASLGVPGRLDDARMTEALAEITRAAARGGPVAGYHVVDAAAAEATARVRAGFRFLALGVDMLFLGDACRSSLALVRAALPPRSADTR